MATVKPEPPPPAVSPGPPPVVVPRDSVDLVAESGAHPHLVGAMLGFAPAIKPSSVAPIMQALNTVVKDGWSQQQIDRLILRLINDPENAHCLTDGAGEYLADLGRARASLSAPATEPAPAAAPQPEPESLTPFQQQQVDFIRVRTNTGIPGAPANLLNPLRPGRGGTELEGQPLTAFAEQAARIVAGPQPAPTPQWGAMTAEQSDTSVLGMAERMRSVAPGQPGRGLRGPQR